MARPNLETSAILSMPNSGSKHHEIRIPSTSIPSTPISPGRPPSPEKQALHDSNTFLTALAAHERRVLELKEELQKAEVDLEKLKKQWSIHEAAKKRNEWRQLEPLQPLNSPPIDVSMYGEGELARTGRENGPQRHKSITTRQPQRRVFSGSRHTKTLSLLSPKPLIPREALLSDTRASAKMRPPRSKTVPDMSASIGHSSLQPDCPPSRTLMQGQPRDDIVETGKQLVGDIREGLWTFFEDLRQATVGDDIDTTMGNAARKQIGHYKPEEGLPASALKNHISRSAHTTARGFSQTGKPKLSGKTAAEIEAMIANSVASPALITKARHQRHMTIQTIPETDGWENWDSPPRQTSPHQSSTESHQSDPVASPVTDCSTPRTSFR
ncbi:MAG: hypothetical protein Q9195_004298 [Heterodermia aff. obscurata]